MRKIAMRRYIFFKFCLIVHLIFASTAFAESFEITSGAAVEFLENPLPGMVFLDVRTAREYAEGHIKGAKLLDSYRIEFEAKLRELNRDAPYVIYCLAGIRSQKVFDKMKKLGFSNVYIMPSGIYDWKDKKLPLVSGSSPYGN